jgi:glycosyltransferase involved in cell wall biosynthesis
MDGVVEKHTTDYGLEGETIVCFAGEDWWYHHPHSKNHILRRLARNNTVLFVNSLSLGLPAISHPDFFLKIRRKLKSYMRWLRKVPEGLYVMSPISMPFFGHRTVRTINELALALQIRLAMLLIGIRRPVVWVAMPSAGGVAKRLNAKLLLYQVSDKFDAMEDTALRRDVIRLLDGRLKRMADVVMYSGRKLFEESDLPHRYFLEQAVDFDHFAEPSPSSAADISAIPHPILGYMGWIDYVMDVPLIEEVAKRRPDWQWVFIGRKSNLVQISGRNIHFLGPKAYSLLPEYVRQVDVFVLPWRMNSEFVNYGSAIKVREYLATGKPVVIAPLYEYRQTPGLRLYRTADEFIAAVEDALQCDTPEDRGLRQSLVRTCTWDVRTREVGTLITSLLAGRGIPLREDLSGELLGVPMSSDKLL